MIKSITLQFLAVLFVLGMAFTSQAQDVGIGTSNPQEKLHVAGNARIDNLAGTNSRLVLSDNQGNLINLATGADGEVLTISSGNLTWGSAGGSSNAWDLNGNAGTSPASNFIGTTDAQDVVFSTNSIEQMRIGNASGTVFVNGTGTLPGTQFATVANGTDVGADMFGFGSSIAHAVEAYDTSLGMLVVSDDYANPAFIVNLGNTDLPALEVENSGGTGYSLLLDHNTNSLAALLDNSGTGRGLEIFMSNTGNADVGLAIFHDGTGRSANISNSSSTTTEPTVFIQGESAANVILNVQNPTTLTTATLPVGFFDQNSTSTTATNAAAVWGQTDGIRAGVFLAAGTSANTQAVRAVYAGTSIVDATGVYAESYPAIGWGVGVDAVGGYIGVSGSADDYGVVGSGATYGIFSLGDFGATGVKTFAIDHPNDPENKILKHFSMESDEVLNVYRGNAELDANGEAVIALPEYFDAINKNFSYYLTPIGAPANLYVKEEITGDEFVVSGGSVGMKVSWVVYAERNDKYLQANPEKAQAEVEKPTKLQGKYLDAASWGVGVDMAAFPPNEKQIETKMLESTPSFEQSQEQKATDNEFKSLHNGKPQIQTP